MSTRTAQGNRTAKGKEDGLLRIFLLTDVGNRPSGIKVTFRISKGLAAKELKPGADMTLSAD